MGGGQYVIGIVCYGNGIGVVLGVGFVWVYEYEVVRFVKFYCFECMCGGVDIVGMIGFDQYEMVLCGVLVQCFWIGGGGVWGVYWCNLWGVGGRVYI